MGYPYDSSDGYSSDEIKQMYANNEISRDEAKNLESENGYWDIDDNWVSASEDWDED